MFRQGLLASIFWAANIILVKVFLNHFDSQVLALYKAFLSSVMLFIVSREKIRLDRKEILILLCTGFFSIYLNYRFSYQGIQEASMAEVSLINALTLVIVRPKLDIFNYLIALAFIIGTYGHINYYLFLSMVVYAIGMYISRLSQSDYKTRTMFSLFFGSLFFLPNFEIIDFTIFQWLLFLGISVLGYGYIMYVYMKTSENNPYLNLHPILTYLASIFIFDEPILVNQMIAFLLVFIAIILSRKDKIKIDK